jgi:hypothetical protein
MAVGGGRAEPQDSSASPCMATAQPKAKQRDIKNQLTRVLRKQKEKGSPICLSGDCAEQFSDTCCERHGRGAPECHTGGDAKVSAARSCTDRY